MSWPPLRACEPLGAIAQAAPIFGLLGTVIGLIDAFSQYEQQGVDLNAGFLSGSMWQALITTATGLALGAVCLLGHHFLVSRVQVAIHEMEWLGSELLLAFARVKSGSSDDREELSHEVVDSQS